MVSMHYEIDGRKVTREQWERHLFHDAPRQMALEAVQKKLSRLRCPTHGTAPTVQLVRRTFGGAQ